MSRSLSTAVAGKEFLVQDGVCEPHAPLAKASHNSRLSLWFQCVFPTPEAIALQQNFLGCAKQYAVFFGGAKEDKLFSMKIAELAVATTRLIVLTSDFNSKILFPS